MVQIVTTALAVLGAVLGVMNAWRNWVHDRVNVQVLFGMAELTDSTPGMSITIRNLSRFAVTIDGVSLSFQGKKHLPINMLAQTLVLPNALPVRLESRTSLTAFIPVAAVHPEQMQMFTHVKASTACGFEFRSRQR